MWSTSWIVLHERQLNAYSLEVLRTRGTFFHLNNNNNVVFRVLLKWLLLIVKSITFCRIGTQRWTMNILSNIFRMKYFYFYFLFLKRNSINRKCLCFPQRPYYSKNTPGTGINNSSFYWIRDGKMRCTRLRGVIHDSFLRKQKWPRKIADLYRKSYSLRFLYGTNVCYAIFQLVLLTFNSILNSRRNDSVSRKILPIWIV